MKINEKISTPMKAQLPNGAVQDVRLRFETYKIESEKDTQELIDVFAEGVEIVMLIPGATPYVIIKKIIPLKIAINETITPPPNPLRPKR